jgi:hypothetical protein
MSFLNSLSTRIPLAVVGGILYGLLTHSIIIFIDLPPPLGPLGGIIVFLFYLGSRLLILFSGIDSPYYSREKAFSKPPPDRDAFYRTTQWVGKFYHYHDLALFFFLVAISIVSAISLILDGLGGKSFGHTIRDLWETLRITP